jgi:hypothetical protein
MYFEDYGYTAEPSKLDTILEEAVDKARHEIKQEVQEELNRVKQIIDSEETATQELLTRNAELERVKKQIEELKAEYEKLDNYKLPKSIVDKMVKAVIDDFYLGQEVYVVNSSFTNENCELCKGNRKITVDINNNKTEVVCPSCNGQGYKFKSEYSIGKKKISRIDLRLCFKKDRVSYWTRECIYLDGDEDPSIKDIFATKEEAEEKLKELEGGK